MAKIPISIRLMTLLSAEITQPLSLRLFKEYRKRATQEMTCHFDYKTNLLCYDTYGSLPLRTWNGVFFVSFIDFFASLSA